jgi:hypothetical protein
VLSLFCCCCGVEVAVNIKDPMLNSDHCTLTGTLNVQLSTRVINEVIVMFCVNKGVLGVTRIVD